MATKEAFDQFADVTNSMGPQSDQVKELYCLVSVGDDGKEGLVSMSLNDDPPIYLQSVTSNKDLSKDIVSGFRREWDPRKYPNIKVRLKRFALAEDLGEI